MTARLTNLAIGIISGLALVILIGCVQQRDEHDAASLQQQIAEKQRPATYGDLDAAGKHMALDK